VMPASKSCEVWSKDLRILEGHLRLAVAARVDQDLSQHPADADIRGSRLTARRAAATAASNWPSQQSNSRCFTCTHALPGASSSEPAELAGCLVSRALL